MDVGQLATQRKAGLVQAGLDGAGPRAEPPGDLGMPEAAEVKERDSGPLAGRQRRDRRAHALGDPRRLGGLLGPGVLGDGV